MPNPTRISLPRVNYNFDAKACVPVLTVMLNKVEKDYSTVDELCDHDELSKFTRDEIKNAVSELNGRKFLLKVDKPYGCVYAVNKLYIAEVESLEEECDFCVYEQTLSNGYTLTHTYFNSGFSPSASPLSRNL